MCQVIAIFSISRTILWTYSRATGCVLLSLCLCLALWYFILLSAYLVIMYHPLAAKRVWTDNSKKKFVLSYLISNRYCLFANSGKSFPRIRWMPLLRKRPPIVKRSTICRYDGSYAIVLMPTLFWYSVLLTIDNVILLLNAEDAYDHLWLRHLLIGHPICLLAFALCGWAAVRQFSCLNDLNTLGGNQPHISSYEYLSSYC